MESEIYLYMFCTLAQQTRNPTQKDIKYNIYFLLKFKGTYTQIHCLSSNTVFTHCLSSNAHIFIYTA